MPPLVLTTGSAGALFSLHRQGGPPGTGRRPARPCRPGYLSYPRRRGSFHTQRRHGAAQGDVDPGPDAAAVRRGMHSKSRVFDVDEARTPGALRFPDRAGRRQGLVETIAEDAGGDPRPAAALARHRLPYPHSLPGAAFGEIPPVRCDHAVPEGCAVQAVVPVRASEHGPGFAVPGAEHVDGDPRPLAAFAGGRVAGDHCTARA